MMCSHTVRKIYITFVKLWINGCIKYATTTSHTFCTTTRCVTFWPLLEILLFCELVPSSMSFKLVSLAKLVPTATPSCTLVPLQGATSFWIQDVGKLLL